MHDKNEGQKTTDMKIIRLKQDRRTLWLIKVLYATMVHWIIGKLYAKNQGPNSKDENGIGRLHAKKKSFLNK